MPRLANFSVALVSVSPTSGYTDRKPKNDLLCTTTRVGYGMDAEGHIEAELSLDDGDSKPDARTAITPHEVQNRHGLSEYLSQSLSSEYHVFEDDGVRQTSTFIKSYLVEFHQDGDDFTAASTKGAFSNLQATNDPSLVMARDRGNEYYFIDRSDERFMVIHTIGRTRDTDQTVKSLVDHNTTGYDRAWLPSQFLLESYIGTLRGFKFSHEPVAAGVKLGRSRQISLMQPAPLPLADEYARLESVKSTERSNSQFLVSAQTRSPKSTMWVKDSNTALDDFNGIRESNIFANRRSLDSIQYRAVSDEQRSINHGLYCNGKIVASGTSIGLHMLAVERLRSSYGAVIRWLEDECSIGWRKRGQRVSFSGEPLIVSFSDETTIVDLEAFARSIFRASRPFRLFGFPHRVTDRRIEVEAIDLHTGDEFSVEVTHEWMRIYLPKGTCGNVIARLYTNLLHCLDSDTELATGSGEIVFSRREKS